MPTSAETNATTISTYVPFHSKGGWKANRKGARKPPMPNRVACQPVVIGLAPAIWAPATAVTATGGVTSASTA